MAIKKKIKKPAKKVQPKKAGKSVAKKAVVKAARKTVSKKPSKPVAKKGYAVKKPLVTKPMQKKHSTIADSKKAIIKALPMKAIGKKPELKHETKPTLHAAGKAEVKKLAIPSKPVKVVIPEIKTKTVRKYEPEFTKSVLDTPQQEITGPTMRYSDPELAEFKDLIMKKLDAAKKELAYLKGLITRKDEMGGDDTDNRYMTMEDGSMSMEREQLSQMASRQITFIDHLEKALMRIENKTYGICRVTGKLIDKARLKAVPHATLSIEAKQTMNK